MVTELAVGITREDLTAVTAKEFDGWGVFNFHLRLRCKPTTKQVSSYVAF
ncbi:hypothetical protein HanRHA438_Chr17g0797881 [Helianthus annuus]|nr:hypothetical protein HanRHA438_Chr17g0797881 [Helianthus annuus]